MREHTQDAVTSQECEEAIRRLQARFEKHMHRHRGIAWSAVQAALEKLQAPTDSGLPTELWNAQGDRLAFVGDVVL